MDTLQELEDRFPYMFSGNHIGIGIKDGWFQTFAKLCQDIDTLLGEDKQGFHWSQVKEKFGSARFYWDLGDIDGPMRLDIQTPQGVLSFEKYSDAQDKDEHLAQLMRQIGALADAAEDATKKLCAVCGEPGTLNETNGYFLTLCPAHAAQRKKA